MPWNTLLCDDEQYNYEYFQRNNVCRLCWSPNASREITKDSENEIKSSLCDKILYCLGIDTTNYSHLNKLCCECTSEIDKFYDFKIFCCETDSKLQHIIQSSSESNIADIKIEKLDILELSSEDNEDSFLNDTESVQNVRITNIKTNKNICEEIQTLECKTRIKNTLSNVIKQRTETSVKNNFKSRIKHSHSLTTFCCACHLDCGSEEKFSEHNATFHGIEENGNLFKCFGCEKRFKSKKRRASHEINFCKGLKDGYKCNVCERFLPKRSLYDKHMRYHLHNRKTDLPEDIFKCKKCFSRFETNEGLMKHMAEHEIKKNYVCETCGRVFTRQDYLYKHTLTHAGVKRHSCPHCDFKATQRSSLTMHIRKHTGERPYSCDLCPQRCVSSSNLRAHRRRHLHIKKYECTICNKKFGYKISLDEHVSSTHERTELHSCEQCGATYSRVRGLRRHMAAKHAKQDLNDKNSEIAKENVHNEAREVAIIKNVRYEIKEGDLLLIKNPDCEVFMV